MNEPMVLGGPPPVLGGQDRVTLALIHVYQSERARLVGLADWMLGGRAMAEEIVQETFVRLVEHPPLLEHDDRLGAYVRTAVVNRCRSRIRRLVLERRHNNSIPEAVEQQRPDQTVRDAVARLPMRQRQCVVLRFFEDLTIDQIADALGVSSGSVKTHLHRAMRSLEGHLSEENVRD